MAYRDSKQTAFIGNSTVSPTPCTIVAGDQLLAFSSQDTSGCTYTGYTGWTKLDTTNITGPDGQTLALFAKVAVGSDTLSITSSAGNDWAVTMVSLSGRTASATPTFQKTTPNTSSNASTVTLTLTGLTAASGDDIAIFGGLDITDNSKTWVVSASTSTIRQNCATGNWSQAATATVDSVSAGATGNYAMTATVTGGQAGWGGYVVTLPASGGGGGDVTVALTGQAATFTAGTLTNSTSKALTGTSATFTAGTLSAAVPRLGRSYVPGPGISPDYRQLFNARNLSTFIAPAGNITVALTGQSGAFSAGTLLPSSTLALTGISGTFGSGQLMPAPQLAISGSSATYASGTMAVSISTALTGIQSLFAAGQIGVAGDVTVSLTGQAATFSTGTLNVSSDDIGGDPPRRRKTRNVIKDGKFVQEKVPAWPFEQSSVQQPDSILVSTKEPHIMPVMQTSQDEDIVRATISLMFEIL